MNIEEIRDYCLSLPMVTEDMPFGDDYLVLRVCGKIFACVGFERPDYFVLKCNPEYALDLRDRYAEIEPAWHWNKRHWNQLNLRGNLADDKVKSLVRHSYCEVVAKLTKKIKNEYPVLLEVQP